MKLYGSVGRKYGAKTHFLEHLRRRISQAAQGLRIMTRGVGDGGAKFGTETCEVEGTVGNN